MAFIQFEEGALPGGGVGVGPAESAEGNALPFSPDWTGSVGLDYEAPLATGRLRLSADYFYSDGRFATEDNRLKQDSYSLVNASATWYMTQSENVSLQAWGRNLEDTAHVAEMLAHLELMLPETRAFEGCEMICIYIDDDDPTCLLTHQRWESREHHEKYVAFRMSQGADKKLMSMMTSPLAPRYFKLTDV